MKKLSNPKIAIVEDNYFYSKLIHHSIKEKYSEVDFYYESKLVLKTNIFYDIVIIDYELSGISGTTLAKAIKMKSPKTKIIMLVSNFDVDAIVNYLNTDVSDLVTRDFGTLGALLDSIENILHIKNVVKQEVY